MALDVAGFKQAQRKIWSAGDYPDIARGSSRPPSTWSQRPTCSPARTCWTWRPAAATWRSSPPSAGANVTGLDLTPELFEAARRRAAEAGVDCEWVEGDAEELPYRGRLVRPRAVDLRHDVRAAPRAGRRRAGARRRPGGTIAVAAWTPEGTNGQMFKTVASHMPPPPPELKPPTLWGNEEHMRELFEPHGVELEFERAQVDFEDESPEAWLEYSEREAGADGDGARGARAAGQVGRAARTTCWRSTGARTRAPTAPSGSRPRVPRDDRAAAGLALSPASWECSNACRRAAACTSSSGSRTRWATGTGKSRPLRR